MTVWLRALSCTELLALVKYGEPLLAELAPMCEAGLLSNVVELGPAWRPLRAALADHPEYQVAPGLAGGVRLSDGVWVVLAADVQRLAPLPTVPEELAPLRAALAELYETARAGEHALLVAGVRDEWLPLRMVSAPQHQALRDETTRLRRHLTLRAEHSISAALHRSETGVHSDDAAERWRAFIDLGDVLVDPQRRVHPAAVEELKGLFIPLLSGQPGRHQAALLLGLLAEAMGRGGPANVDEIAHKMHRNLRIIGADWHNGDWPGVLEEALPSARICLALCAARVGFATEDLAEPLVGDAREMVTEAASGDQGAFRRAMELALELAQAGG